MVIAVDGPAGSGKSSVSKEVAKRKEIAYLDTGAMYRMVTYYMLANGIDPQTDEISEVLRNIDIGIDGTEFYVNGDDVTLAIRTHDVNNMVSEVSARKEVRDFLVEQQRKIGRSKDIIIDGRDIGTVVFPNADYKFYLEASPEERAKRRVKENEGLDVSSNYDEILESIKNRDYLDSNRSESPLKMADDAVLIDTTSLSFEDVVGRILERVN